MTQASRAPTPTSKGTPQSPNTALPATPSTPTTPVGSGVKLLLRVVVVSPGARCVLGVVDVHADAVIAVAKGVVRTVIPFSRDQRVGAVCQIVSV
jgi:hypothetical protein